MTGERLVLDDVRAPEAVCEQDFREQDFRAIVGMLDQGVIILRTDGHLTYINPAAMRIYGVHRNDDVVEIFNHFATAPCYYADGTRVPHELHPAALAFRTGAFTKQIYGVELPSGERRWLLTSGRLVNPDDPASDVLVSFSDITAERDELDRLIHQVNHDPLTGLPNRTVVLRRIAEALASTDRKRLRAVLFVDLDDLKSTNDTFGHEAGDDLLKAAAGRLRQSMGPADVVARHGGDEFVCLVYGNAGRDELDGRVGRLRDRLAEPVYIAKVLVPIRASIGIVDVDHDDRRSAEDILNDADRAMYAAKRARRR
ncbi:diguanylate cyclase [Mycolicibacterium moriokaense]|nr:diguanylate cyclase [Mycolicibacterium moriokaense]